MTNQQLAGRTSDESPDPVVGAVPTSTVPSTRADGAPLPPPPPPDASAKSHSRFTSEVMAGGSVTEADDDELAGGWRGVLGMSVIVALFVWLGLVNLWMLVFVLGVFVAIFLHELGHFMTARWTGMKATQFFIGFGPRVWSFRRGETEYGVRLLPLGAFVRIIGMNSMDEVPPADENRTYRSKSYPRRLLVITAGSIMHMLLAIVLLFTVYAFSGENTPVPGAQIGQVEAGAPAAVAGLQPNDIIVAVDSNVVAESDDLGPLLQAHSPGDVVDLDVLRDGQSVTLPVTLAENTDAASELYGKPYVGISSGPAYVTVEHSVPAAAVNAVTDIFPQSWQMAKGAVTVLNPLNVISHLDGSNQDLATRPTTLVGVTAISDDVGNDSGFIGILYMLALLNVFIGVFNMLPLLPLDGGHAAIATYERLRERNGVRYYADVEKLMPFAMAVMAMLLFLFVSGFYLDITQPIG